MTNSDKGFQHVSFVNSIATTKGGRHVDYVTDQVFISLAEEGPNPKVAYICFFIDDYVSLGSPDQFKPKAHLGSIWEK